VPVGTVVYSADQDDHREQLADLSAEGQTWLAARGGRGGRGNRRFSTSTNRAPRRFETGRPGESRTLRLQLKLLADVGLVGFPNAGKSTFIARISAAHPKVADYPFTTLEPHLGVVSFDEFDSFVVADIPGIIAGAHEGLGLGLRFLRHIERTKVLLHLVDLAGDHGRDPAVDYETVNRELAAFNPEMLRKPTLVVASKIDAMDDSTHLEALNSAARERGLDCHSISAVTGQGLESLKVKIWGMLERLGAPAAGGYRSNG